MVLTATQSDLYPSSMLSLGESRSPVTGLELLLWCYRLLNQTFTGRGLSPGVFSGAESMADPSDTF